MKFTATLLSLALLAPTAVLSIQNIFVGTIGGCSSNKYGPDWYVWFTDSPTCGQGTDVGPTSYFGNTLCDRNVTILGHENIEFTGCQETSTGVWGPPTAVEDNGAPALKCQHLSPTTYTKCPSPCGSSYPKVDVDTLLRCS